MHALAAQYTPARPRPSLYFQIDPITANRTMCVVCVVYIKKKIKEFRGKKILDAHKNTKSFFFSLDQNVHDP